MVMPKLKKFGSRVTFEFFVETWKPQAVKELRNWLKKYTPDDIRNMVNTGKFPDFSDLNFSAASDYIAYIEKISLLRLVEEFLLPARPDLIEAVQELEEAGGKWLNNLRLHLLDRIRNSATSAERASKENLVMATCDNCKKSWTVAKEEIAKLKECPFCGHGINEPPPEETIDKGSG